jgi:hypothetical protein
MVQDVENCNVFRKSRRGLSSFYSMGIVYLHVRLIRCGVLLSNPFLSDLFCIGSLVLFLIYFPAHLKYTGVRATIDSPDSKPTLYYRDTTSEWKLGVTLAAVVGLHLYVF